METSFHIQIMRLSGRARHNLAMSPGQSALLANCAFALTYTAAVAGIRVNQLRGCTKLCLVSATDFITVLEIK
jgi:hypothetical protein